MLLNSSEVAAFKHVVKSCILPHFKRHIEKITPRGCYWIRGHCSFQTCCEIVYITTFQKEYWKNNSKRMLLNSRDIAAFKHVVKSYILPHFKRIFEKELQEDVTELEGHCSFQTCCEIMYIATFQEEYLKNNSKRMLLNSREVAAFKHVVKSYILPHFKRNI